MKIEDLSNYVIDHEVYCDRIPIISTLVNLYYLFQKCVIDIFKIDSSARSFNAEHISHKSYDRCLVLLIPVLGNIVVYLYEKLFSETPKPILEANYFHGTQTPSKSKQDPETIKKVYEECLAANALSKAICLENVFEVLLLAHQNSKAWLVDSCSNYSYKEQPYENNLETIFKWLEFGLQNEISALSRVMFFKLFVYILHHQNSFADSDGSYFRQSTLPTTIQRKIWDFAQLYNLGFIKAYLDPHISHKGLSLTKMNNGGLSLTFDLETLMQRGQLEHLVPRKNRLATFLSLKACIQVQNGDLIRDFFERATAFENLKLWNNEFCSKDENAISTTFQKLTQLHSLRRLTLGTFQAKEFSESVKKLPHLVALKIVKFDGDLATLGGIIRNNKQWKKIGIAGGYRWEKTGETSYQGVVTEFISKDLGEFLSALEDNTTLSKLVLRNHAIEAQGAELLAAFMAKKPHLCALDLRGNTLQPLGILQLNLDTNTTLIELRLTINSLYELAAINGIIKNNKTLQTIVLEFNFFQEEMWDTLLQALTTNTTLRALKLDLTYEYTKKTDFPAEGEFLANLCESKTALREVQPERL